MPQILFTIGHSNHQFDAFVALLELQAISAVCDVRSHPYSRYNPQFNRETLQVGLRQSEIAYLFLGRRVGGPQHGSVLPRTR